MDKRIDNTKFKLLSHVSSFQGKKPGKMCVYQSFDFVFSTNILKQRMDVSK